MVPAPWPASVDVSDSCIVDHEATARGGASLDAITPGHWISSVGRAADSAVVSALDQCGDRRLLQAALRGAVPCRVRALRCGGLCESAAADEPLDVALENRLPLLPGRASKAAKEAMRSVRSLPRLNPLNPSASASRVVHSS
jgi:hypothetical protein